MDTITREQALDLLRAQQPEPHMIQHALASEAVLRALAGHLDEDAELWGLTGLLHDLDYPLTQNEPQRHGRLGANMLTGLLPDAALTAILAHNAGHTGAAPESPLDFALRCGETVTGLVITAALVRPSGMEGMEARSLKKKMKDKAFAANVNRDCIRECERIGLDLDAFLTLSVSAMAPHAAALGLAKA
jgi:putative nucleotidyltransferase with HDIG domain